MERDESMKALCIGHITYDITLPMDAFPIENNKYRIDTSVECGGGPAANAAYLLSLWKTDTTFAGIIGDDYYGKKVEEELKKVNINTKYLEKGVCSTASGYIIANTTNGSRTIIIAKTPNYSKIDTKINEKYDLVLVDGEHLETATYVLENNKDAITIIDAGTLKNETMELGKKVKYLACSKQFAKDFTKIDFANNDLEKLQEVYEKLEDYFHNQIIITLESSGAFTKIDNTYKIIPSIKVKAVDSTGAGDIFHGALAYFLLNNYSLEKAIGLANITGALSVTKIGSKYSMPMLDEVLDAGKRNGFI